MRFFVSRKWLLWEGLKPSRSDRVSFRAVFKVTMSRYWEGIANSLGIEEELYYYFRTLEYMN